MNKKKILLITIGVLLLVVAAVVGWWSFRRSHAKTALALPANITMVGRVNFAEAALRGLDMEHIKAMLADDRKTGIDFTADHYVFAADGYLGAVIALDDEDQALKYVSEHAEVTKQRGIHWATGTVNWLMGVNFLMACDGDRAMFIGPVTSAEQDALRNTLYTCLRQKKGEGGVNSPLYQKLLAVESPVAVATNLSSLAPFIGEQAAIVLPEGVKLDDFTLTASCAFDEDETEVALEVQEEGKKAKKFLDQLALALQPIDGSLRSSAPLEPFAQLEVGVRGEQLLELLRQNPTMRAKLLAANMVCDLDMFIRSIDGDVSLVKSKYEIFSGRNMLLQARLTNNDFMKNVNSWNGGISASAGVKFLQARNNYYLCAFNRQAFYFGADSTRFFASEAEYLFNHHDLQVKRDESESEALLQLSVGEAASSDFPVSFRLTCNDVRHWTFMQRVKDRENLLQFLPKQ